MMMVMVVTMTMKIMGVIMLTLLEMINEIMTMTNEIKGIRDAGSTADFRICFEILKFKNLKI